MGAKPPPKRGAGAKPHSLCCFSAYIGGCGGISPTPKSPGSQQGPQACWVVGRVYLTIVLILEHNIKGFVVVFLVCGGKYDADVLSTLLPKIALLVKLT